jgi:hypothetical protein
MFRVHPLCSGDASRCLLAASHQFVGIVGSASWLLVRRFLIYSWTPHSNGDPPLRLQQPAPKPSIFPSDSDSQHSFTYLCEFPESST